jgi:transcription initiation factor TFIIE subunit alpha
MRKSNSSKKMAIKKEIEYITNEIFGSEAIPLTLYLNGKDNISEFVIAKDLTIEIHRVRQILYKLLEDNIVIFNRKKDKLKGWYICYWSLNLAEFPYIIRKIKKAKLEKLKIRLKQETTEDFYMCKNACTRMNFDNAFEINFKCPDCGGIMNLQSSERTIAFLTEKIIELEKEISKEPIVAKVEKKPIDKPKAVKTTKDKSFEPSTKLKKIVVKKVIRKKAEPKKAVKKKIATKKKTTTKAKKTTKSKPVKKIATKKKVTPKKKPSTKQVKKAKTKKKRFSLFKKKK